MQTERKCECTHYTVFQEKTLQKRIVLSASCLSLDPSQVLVDMVFTQRQQILSTTTLLEAHHNSRILCTLFTLLIVHCRQKVHCGPVLVIVWKAV